MLPYMHKDPPMVEMCLLEIVATIPIFFYFILFFANFSFVPPLSVIND
jgi:hypothetical protein